MPSPTHRGRLMGTVPARRVVVMAATIAAAAAAGGALLVAGAAPARAATAVTVSLGPSPVAPAGSLTSGQRVALSLRAADAAGSPAGNAAVWLSFSSTNGPDGGSASAAGTALTGTPQMFTTGRDGILVVTYTTAVPLCGQGVCTSSYPSSGTDTVTAAGSAGGAGAVTDAYDYAGSGPAPADRYVFSPTPLAGPSSLAPGQQVPLTLTVETGGGQPEPGATVYLSLAAPGGGTVTTACGTGSLASSPQACTVDSSGRIPLTYTAGAGPGRDVITAQNKPSGATETGTDAYDYAAPVYSLSPSPVAPQGTLGSSQAVTVTLSATDATGHPLVSTPVLLSVASGAGGPGAGGSGAGGSGAGGSAIVGSFTATGGPSPNTTVGPAPAPFLTDADGHILLTYSTPAGVPAAGTDLVTAESAAVSPATAVTDGYTYGPAVYVFSPAPVASPGAVAPGGTAHVTLTVQSGGQADPGATVFLSLIPAPGGGQASVGGTPLTSDPASFTADSAGKVVIDYRAPDPEPRTGVDTIVAQDAPSAPTVTAADRYGLGAAPASAAGQRYWLVGRDCGVFSFGTAGYFGSEGGHRLNAPIVAIAATPDGGGYWCVAADGGVFSFGDAGFHGSAGALRLAQPITGVAVTPDGQGYWLVARDGGVFTYGDAGFHGSGVGSSGGGSGGGAAPVIGMAATPDGGGYWIASADGSVAAFGDARSYGGAGGRRLNAPIVGVASTATGNGYWLVGSDGGVFCFGDAFFYGSTGGLRLMAPVVGLAPTANGAGYWFVAADGGVFSYGNAGFHGSMGGIPLQQPVVGMAGG